MSVLFKTLLSDVLSALGDDNGLMWSRIDKIWPWCVEAMRTFPFLRPQLEDHTIVAGEEHRYDLPDNFREVISVEYPVDQQPPAYLVKKNRLDPDFYSSNNFFDVDHNYSDGIGWIIHFSATLSEDDHVYVEYMAEHDLDMLDDNFSTITVPDEFYSILIAKLIVKAYRERLSYTMQDPTAHSTIIQQLTEMVRKAEQSYASQVADAQQRISNSKISPRLAADQFDRVY
jgi:hypothetical protein